MACALHDGLCALQLHFWIIADAEIAITIAGQQMANLTQSHIAIHFRIAATFHIEIEMILPLRQHFNFQRIILGLEWENIGKVLKIRRPAKFFREVFPLFDC